MFLLFLPVVIPIAMGADFRNFTFPVGGTFGNFSDGAGLDLEGNLYAANYFTKGSNVSLASSMLGKVNVVKGSVVEGIVLSDGQEHMYNGVDFDRSGNAYVADAQGNKVYKASKTKLNGRNVYANPTVVCDLKSAVNNTGILAPNDIVMSYDGQTAYLSGMNYVNNTGLIARCDIATGTIGIIYRGLRTNGIEISADQSKIYFTEGGDKEKWINAMNLNSLGTELIYNFTLGELPATSDLDGMRFDANGTLYVSMTGSAKVALVDVKNKKVASYVDLPLMSHPRSLAIGGKNVTVVGHNQGVVSGLYTFAAQAAGARFSNIHKPVNGTQGGGANASSAPRLAIITAPHLAAVFVVTICLL